MKILAMLFSASFVFYSVIWISTLSPKFEKETPEETRALYERETPDMASFTNDDGRFRFRQGNN